MATVENKHRVAELKPLLSSSSSSVSSSSSSESLSIKKAYYCFCIEYEKDEKGQVLHKKNSVVSAIVLLVNNMIGSGILIQPYAFKMTGIGAAIVEYFVIALLTHTGTHHHHYHYHYHYHHHHYHYYYYYYYYHHHKVLIF